MKFNQLVARGLVLALLASNIPVALAETTVPAIPESPSIESSTVPAYSSLVTEDLVNNNDLFEKLLEKFKIAIKKDENVARVYMIKTQLNTQTIKTEVEKWLEANKSMKDNLALYGLDANSISDLVDAVIDELPTESELTGANPDMSNLFVKMYKDPDEITYSKYATDIQNLSVRLYNELPNEVQSKMDEFTKGGVSKQQVVKQIVNVLIDEKIGVVKKDTRTSNLSEWAFGIPSDSTAKEKIADILKENADGPTDANINEFAEAFYNLGDIVIESAYNSLEADGKVAMNILSFEMGMLKELLWTSPNPNDNDDDDDDDDDDNNSGSSGGNGGAPSGNTGGNNNNDDSDLSDDDQDKVDDIKDNLPQAGEDATDAQKEAAKDAADDLIANMDEDVAKAKDADKQVEAVSEVIGDTIAALDAEEAVEVAEEFVEMVDSVLDNPNVSVEEQTEMVTNVIENTFSKLVANEEATEADLVEIKEEMAALVETVVKNAATVEVLESTTPQAGEGASEQVKSFEIGAADLKSTIANAVKVQAELAKTLKDSGMADVAKEVEKVVNIALPEVKATEEVALTLDAEAVKTLGEQGVGVTVEAKGLNFKLPAELMKASTDLSITSKPVTRADNLTTNTDAGKVMNHKTLNVSVADGEETVKGMVELSFSLDDVNVDLDQLMVGVFEDGKWTKLDYTVVDNQVVFTAPHFSIYSLMTFTPSFTDIEASWAKKYITSLTAKGIVSGKSAEMFDPNATLTRAEFTTMIVKHLGLDVEMKQNFKDVSEDAWYYNYIGNAGLNGLTAGVENGEFRPNDPITREEMAVMLYRAYKLKRGFALETGAAPFSDHAKISSDALDAVYAVRTNGIISGYPDNTFRPEANATRAEAATMLYLFLEK
ncbi:S-layer homology domain-containing protein [Acidaminobacter sp. JC074]|uniref:S-layer homology domain-containing protein n=1 Tax=Acidaminobacter sp. JC074 TaxID=2530199 RepID=UPI001F0FF59C|nr:S-layer homology domain-containing protein [Acidaminobacter sp. JC074]MCH4890318.1 S-layer homology domain-containing protein [Acidaminobacter sp. JC074]